MYNQLDLYEKELKSGKSNSERLSLLQHEINQEEQKWGNLSCKDCQIALTNSTTSRRLDRLDIDYFLNILRNQYTKTYADQLELLEKKRKSFGQENYTQLKENFTNEALLDQVTNRRESDKLVIEHNRIIRKDNPIYFVDAKSGILSAPFNTPVKYIFGQKLSTFWMNILVLWLFVALSWIALQYDALRKLIELFNRIKR
jgi:ABC transport system ATP-binding/permease protein